MNRLNSADELQLAILLFKKLVLDLDAGDRSSINMVAELLSDYSDEIILTAGRMQLTLDKIVQHDLDKDKLMGPILKKPLQTVGWI